jgi:enoyl-CoA hydratase/carnithine racemase
MSTDCNPSHNGRGSPAWSRSWTHMSVDRRSSGYCRITFDHPPTNAVTATTVLELAELVELIEHDQDLNVVVFASANPDFYLVHDDPSPTSTWFDALVRLSRAPAVSVAAIRGRVRGAGSGLAVACDLRFASRENTLVGHGGGPSAGLTRLVGRGRALEILLVADDLDGPRAEQYGYVNRAIADDRLDDEVDALALRLAGLDHDAIARTKADVDAELGRRFVEAPRA